MNSPPVRPEWLTPAQAIAHLQIGSLSALYRLVREHRLPYGRIGKHYRFRRDHLDRWIEVRGIDALQLMKVS
jgi:excisionase family DNA binding protein